MRFDFNLTALIHASNTIWAATANKSATRKEIIQIQFFLSFLLSFFLSFSLFFYHHLHHLSLSLCSGKYLIRLRKSAGGRINLF